MYSSVKQFDFQCDIQCPLHSLGVVLYWQEVETNEEGELQTVVMDYPANGSSIMTISAVDDAVDSNSQIFVQPHTSGMPYDNDWSIFTIQ